MSNCMATSETTNDSKACVVILLFYKAIARLYILKQRHQSGTLEGITSSAAQSAEAALITAVLLSLIMAHPSLLVQWERAS